MTGQKEAYLASSRSIHSDLLELIEGMDYCLDWKPEADAWSAREIIYHLLDTPPGGFHRALRGLLTGDLKEFELWSDLSNITPERVGHDLGRVRQDIDAFFRRMEEALGAAREEDFEGKSILVHQRNRGWDEPRTARNLLEGLFARHWREHLGQIRELRESLGIGGIG